MIIGMKRIAIILGLTLSCRLAPAGDWPEWRGRERLGVWKETGILTRSYRWIIADLGSGFSNSLASTSIGLGPCGRHVLLCAVAEAASEARLPAQNVIVFAGAGAAEHHAARLID